MKTSRRGFIKITTLGGSALALGLFAESGGKTPFAPSVWVRIEADGTVSLTAGKCEMGQGVRTSLPMILAEELDADWERVRVVQGEPGPGIDTLGTGGSFSVRSLWTPMRTAGAAAREMLVAAAAARLGVDAATLRTE